MYNSNVDYPAISVIVPVYNSEKYIKKCLDSLLVQTFKEFEIICVNDGSSDTSGQILINYSEKDQRIIVKKQNHSNAGTARNLGFLFSRGDYVIFLDADDFFEPELLEVLYKNVIDEKADISMCRSDAYVEDYDIYQKQGWSFIIDDENVFMKHVGWAWDKLISRSLIINNNLQFQEIRSSNDMSFTYTAILLSDRICQSSQILIHHRVNNNSSLSNTTDKKWNCFYLALLELKKNLIKHNLYEQYKKDFINYSVYFFLWHFHRLSKENKKQAIRLFKEEGVNNLEISDKTISYFYDKKDYLMFKNILYPKSIPFAKTLILLFGVRKSIKYNGVKYTIKRVLFHLHLAEDNDFLRTMEAKEK